LKKTFVYLHFKLGNMVAKLYEINYYLGLHQLSYYWTSDQKWR